MPRKNQSAGTVSIAALDELAQKALGVAKDSENIDSMLKAVQLSSVVHELHENEHDGRWGKTAQVFASYTAIFAVLLSMATLIFQYVRFRTTDQEQRDNADRTQWRDALKNLSTKDDSSVLSSAMEMQTFLRDSQYAVQSRSVAVALLPLLGDGDQFDTVWEGMMDTTVPNNQFDLISINRSVAAEEVALFARVSGKKFRSDNAASRDFIEFVLDPDRPERGWVNPPSARLSPPKTEQSDVDGTKSSNAEAESEYARDRERKPLKRALTSTWKLDSMGHGLSVLWKSKRVG